MVIPGGAFQPKMNARQTSMEHITVYATSWCGDCHRAKRVLDRLGARYRWIDVDQDLEAAAEVIRINGGYRSVPTIVFPDGSILVEPTDGELEAKLAA
jgi:mycoredoxin